MSRRKPVKRTKYQDSSDDDDDLDDKDIFSLFATDQSKAQKAKEKINQAKIEAEKKRQAEIKRQKIDDFQRNKEMLKKKGIFHPSVAAEKRVPKQYTKGQYVPPLPPPPESIYSDLNVPEDPENSSDEENPFTGKVREPEPQVSPEVKKFVGEQYGIAVDVPKQPLPTRFVAGMPHGAQKIPPWKLPYQQVPYGYPQYTLNGVAYPQMPIHTPMAPPPNGMIPSIDPTLAYNQGASPPPGFPTTNPYYNQYTKMYQPPIPQGPFTPNPTYDAQLEDPTINEEAVAKQHLMEESGITIAPPNGSFDFTSRLTPQQKLVYSSGIEIQPRDRVYGSAQLQIGDHTYQTAQPVQHLPATVHTSLGTITIGKQHQSNEPMKQPEMQKPVKSPIELVPGGASANADKPKPLTVGQKNFVPPTVQTPKFKVEPPKRITDSEGKPAEFDEEKPPEVVIESKQTTSYQKEFSDASGEEAPQINV